MWVRVSKSFRLVNHTICSTTCIINLYGTTRNRTCKATIGEMPGSALIQHRFIVVEILSNSMYEVTA